MTFVNTSTPAKCVETMKPLSTIQKFPDNCNEVTSLDMIEK